MADFPGEIGAWLDILLDTIPTIIIAIVTLIIGFILAYVAGEMVREVFGRIGRDRATGRSGPKHSVMAGKIAKALVFAVVAISAIQLLAELGPFGEWQATVENYGIRFVLGLLVMFVGAFLSDIASPTLACWLHGGACISEETDPTRELVFLGLIVSVVLVGLGIMIVDSLAVLMIFLATLVIGVTLVLLESRRRMRGVE